MLDLIEATCFLYPSYEAAERGFDFGGSGVLVAIPSEERPNLAMRYVVSNWHVAVQGGNSFIRLNTKNGRTHIVETDPAEWNFLAGGSDLACYLIRHVPEGVQAKCVPISFFVDQDEPGAVIQGDDVFMVGRFIDYDGRETNQPALRFGNISMVDAPVRQSNGYSGPSIVIDMHSRSGFSGSPVYIYRDGPTVLPFPLPGARPIDEGRTGVQRSWGFGNRAEVRLLGLHWGHFPERWDIRGKAEHDTGEGFTIRDGAYVAGFSGMSCTVPAKQILELLRSSAVSKERSALVATLT